MVFSTSWADEKRNNIENERKRRRKREKRQLIHFQCQIRNEKKKKKKMVANCRIGKLHKPCFADILPDSRLFSIVWMHQHNSISNCCVVSLELAVGDGAAGGVTDVLVLLVLASFCDTVPFSAARVLRLLELPLVSWPLGLGLEYDLFMFFSLPVLLWRRAFGGGILLQSNNVFTAKTDDIQ